MFFIVLLFLVFIFWQVYAATEGYFEGLYYSCKYCSHSSRLRQWDEHKFYTVRRFIVGAGFSAAYTVFLYINKVDWYFYLLSALYSFSFILVFPFWHDGYLYIIRNYFNNPLHDIPYPGGWRAQPDGKAIFDFTYRQRLIMFITGWLLLVLVLIFNLILL